MMQIKHFILQVLWKRKYSIKEQRDADDFCKGSIRPTFKNILKVRLIITLQIEVQQIIKSAST
jgi:hypothetical protein